MRQKILLLLSFFSTSHLASRAEVETTTSADIQRKSRAISNAVSSGINYQPPPPPKSAEQIQAEEEAAEQESRKNGIIRLPKYVVLGQRPTVFVERDFHNSKALAALALARNQGLNTGPLASNNAPIALQALREEIRLQQISSLKATSAGYRAAGDTGQADELDGIIRDTYRRTDDSFSPGRYNDRLNPEYHGGRAR